MSSNGSISIPQSSRPTNKKKDLKNEGCEQKPLSPKWVWTNILLFAILHSCGFWGLWVTITYRVKLLTILYAYFIGWITVEATMIGAHRFFSHKAFKGTFWFKLLVILTHTIAGQNSIYTWVRDHRLHHKYSETDADPHNSSRGFFFSHMGWLLQKKHPMVKLKGKDINMSDLEAEPLVMFQKKNYYLMFLLLGVALPILPPVYLWGETWKNSVLVWFARYMISLHGTWTVNSFAHLYGNKPYTKDIAPVESDFVAWLSSGEGWHNYHHTFPWDYRNGEFGKKWNLSAKLVDWFAEIGLVYDLKFATPEMIQHRIMKRGDGTHPTIGASGDESCDEAVLLKLNHDEMEDLYGEQTKTGFSHVHPSRASDL